MKGKRQLVLWLTDGEYDAVRQLAAIHLAARPRDKRGTRPNASNMLRAMLKRACRRKGIEWPRGK